MESFEKLVVQYEQMIYKILHSLHIYKNWDEFYQLGLIGLWEADQRFDSSKGNFTNYAYTFIKGKFLTEMRKSKLYEERNVFQKEEFWEFIEDCQSQHQVENKRFTACKTLTENQQKWLTYTVINQLSIKEIAEIEKVSISAVKSWRVGAREKMKNREMVEMFP